MILIQNMVSSAYLQNTVEVELAAYVENMINEPEKFPGKIYILNKPKTANLVFASGNAM